MSNLKCGSLLRKHTLTRCKDKIHRCSFCNKTIEEIRKDGEKYVFKEA